MRANESATTTTSQVASATGRFVAASQRLSAEIQSITKSDPFSTINDRLRAFGSPFHNYSQALQDIDWPRRVAADAHALASAAAENAEDWAQARFSNPH